MSQPQITVNDYSAASVVVRTTPEDFLKNYAGILSDPALMGKWNPNLKGPSGGRLPGWIFPKKNEASLRDVLGRILNGQVPQTPSERQLRYSQQPASPSLLTPSAAPVSVVSSMGSLSSPTTMTLPRRSPALPGGAPAGYQQMMITVIKPEVGQVLNLMAEGQVVPVTIVEMVNDREFRIRLSDGQESVIVLETAWKVPGYCVDHQITRP